MNRLNERLAQVAAIKTSRCKTRTAEARRIKKLQRDLERADRELASMAREEEAS